MFQIWRNDSGLTSWQRKRCNYIISKMYDFYKNKKSDKVYWVDNMDSVGQHLFSFDKQTVFNLFADYPHNLTTEQREIFDKENPYWADFFKDRG